MSTVTREHLAGLELAERLLGGISACDSQKLAEMIAQASAAPEQEPVAWVIDWPEEPELGHYFSDESNPTARSRPLYTHSDPSEVVRLAELVATGNDLLNAATQRADAADRKLGDAFKVVEMAQCLYANNVGISSELEKALALLSTEGDKP